MAQAMKKNVGFRETIGHFMHLIDLRNRRAPGAGETMETCA